MFEKIFKLKENNTNVKREIGAGVTTFLAMAYILFVNPDILGASGMDAGAAYTATILSVIIATLIMGLYANYPVGLAPGMGVNAFFAFTVCGVMGYTWQEALVAVFISGIIFMIVSATGLRNIILNAIPASMKLFVGAGIGFFIAFIGLKNAGIIVANESTFVGLGNLGDPMVLLALFGLVLAIILTVMKVRGGIIISMAVTAVVGLVYGLIAGVPEGSVVPSLPGSIVSLPPSIAPTFAQCFKAFGSAFAHPNLWAVVFAFFFVDFFDTAGTLLAVGDRAGLVKDNKLIRGERAVMADAIGTVAGAVLGTSTVTSFVESMTGVEAGGRTGLTACTTAFCFALALFFSPLLSIFTSPVTACALIIVGCLMISSVGRVEWGDMTTTIPGFITIIMMMLCYSITDGIAFGFITYVIAMVSAKRAKEVHPVMYVLAALFVLYFALKALGVM